MFLEYFGDELHDGPLVLVGDVSPADAATLVAAIQPLASGAADSLALDELPGMRRGTRVASFKAFAVDWNGGCRPVPKMPGHFQCAVRPNTWDQIASFLEPFTVEHEIHIHQYLSDEGSITWIVSNDSVW